MIVTTVSVFVKPEFIENFIEATKKNHEGSLKEPGNIRFDVLQSLDDPSLFTLYEAFESPEAVDEHKKTEHYLTWKNKVAEMMAKPRQGLPHKVICPEERNKW